MPEPALRIKGLRAVLDPEAVATMPLRARVEAATVRLTPEGIAALLPPRFPGSLLGLEGGRIQLRVTWKGIPTTVEALPEGTSAGTLRFRFTGLRLGPFPLPPGQILGMLLPYLVGKAAGIRTPADGTLEIDVQQIARGFHLEVPPLARVVVTPEAVELRFGA